MEMLTEGLLNKNMEHLQLMYSSCRDVFYHVNILSQIHIQMGIKDGASVSVSLRSKFDSWLKCSFFSATLAGSLTPMRKTATLS